MATITETIDSIFVSTWPYFVPGISDAVFLKKYPFYFWLSSMGHVKRVAYGKQIRMNLEIDVNSTVTEIGKTGQVSLTDVDPFTQVRYDWGTIAGNINRYRDEDTENVGRARVFDLLEGKKNNLTKSIQRKFESVLFRAEDSKPEGGYESLLDLVDDTPTSSKTVGGFQQNGNAWWQNVTRPAGGVASLWLRKDLQRLRNDLEDRTFTPDLILGHRNAFEAYEDDLLEITRIVNKKLADASYQHLVYSGIAMIKSPSCPSTRLWMLSSDNLYLIIHPAMDFAMTQWKERDNQPFNKVAQIVVKGQLVCTNRFSQATLHTMTY